MPNLPALEFRAQVLRNIRDYFFRQGVLEVETPVLSRGISLDCHIDVFSARFHPLGYPRAQGSGDSGMDASGEPYYLQTSPEPHMKRLLCRGFPDIYQICKSFRNGEKGERHNPEFTMLEWYRNGYTLTGLMDEVEKVCLIATGPLPSVRKTYSEVFREFLNIDPLVVDIDQLFTLLGP